MSLALMLTRMRCKQLRKTASNMRICKWVSWLSILCFFVALCHSICQLYVSQQQHYTDHVKVQLWLHCAVSAAHQLCSIAVLYIVGLHIVAQPAACDNPQCKCTDSMSAMLQQPHMQLCDQTILLIPRADHYCFLLLGVDLAQPCGAKRHVLWLSTLVINLTEFAVVFTWSVDPTVS